MVTRCRRGERNWKRWVLPAVLVLVLSRVLEGAHQTSSSPLVRFPLLIRVLERVLARLLEVMLVQVLVVLAVVVVLLARLLELLVRRSRVVATVASVRASWSRRTLPKRCGDRAGRRGRSGSCVRLRVLHVWRSPRVRFERRWRRLRLRRRRVSRGCMRRVSRR